MNGPDLVELSHPLPRKVAVFGAGGKSTLARAIALKMDLEFIEIDWINHMPGWQNRPPEEAARMLKGRIDSSPDGFITDHHSSFLRELIYKNVESAIVLELPWRTIFWRRFKRSMKRAGPTRLFAVAIQKRSGSTFLRESRQCSKYSKNDNVTRRFSIRHFLKRRSELASTVSERSNS